MRFQYIKPSGILAQFIKHYWVLETEASDGETCERVIPTGNLELMFHYKDPFYVKKDNCRIIQPRSIISGISSNYADIIAIGETGVITVTFYPFGACNFFNFPLIEIENKSIPLDTFHQSEVKSIEEKLFNTSSLLIRIKIIEQYLLKKLKLQENKNLLLLKYAINQINLSKGQISTDLLSEKLFTTSRSLERKFSAMLGKTPKQFSKIVRFQEIIRCLSIPGEKSLTNIAYQCGYFDQAHFIKDFKSLSGYTPKELLTIGECHSDYFE